MRRFALPLALLLIACGDETVGTASGFTTTVAGTTTTGSQPTTSGDPSSSASTSTSSASGSASGTTTGDPDTGSTTPGLDATSNEESGTTVESTSDATTSTSGTTGTTGTGTTSSGTTGTDSSTSDTSTGHEVVPPVPGGTCNLGQGELTTFVDPMPQPDELHIVAMYQATGNAATVTLTRTGVPLTLFLSSYEPVAFTLDVAPGVQLEHVILDGYNPHDVQGQGAATVTDISGNFGDPFWVACGYFWPMNDGGCDTPGNVAAAEGLTGLQLTSFAGCYEGLAFTLD